jgi:hypothetical protein
METLVLPAPSRADLALSLALVSVALPFLPLAPAAWWIAFRERRAIEAGRADPRGLGTLATARVIAFAGGLFSLLLFLATIATALAAFGLVALVRALF